MDPSFWKGKKVLLTGHTGFKGSWLALWLSELGTEVTGYSLSTPTDPSLYEIASVAENINSVFGDVRNLVDFKKAASDFMPDIIIHMAALSLVRKSYRDPVETYSTNVMGSVHVFEVARLLPGVKVVLNITSDKCYENKEWNRAYTESDRLGGYDPYSNSKGCAEMVTQAYRDSFFNPSEYSKHGKTIASARAGNVIGGGDWAQDRLVPDIMNRITVGDPVIIRNPDALRPWQHVMEPLHGYLCLVEKMWQEGTDFDGGWNFGPNEESVKPVSWLADKLTSQWGNHACWHKSEGETLHEANILKLDSTKAKTLIGWKTKLDLETALQWVVEWYRAYEDNDDMRQMTIKQIMEYQNLGYE